MNETMRFRSLPVTGISAEIDRIAHVIYACSVACRGEAAGHNLLFDGITLRQLAELGNARPGGVKSRFTHPGLSEDGLGKFLGRMRNFRLGAGGDKLLGDLHLSPSAAEAPAGDLRAYVENLAEEDPAAFGISVVVDLYKAWVLADGSEKPLKEFPQRPENATTSKPVARIRALFAADAVDEPALNPEGLFASQFFVKSNRLAEEVYQDFDQYIARLGVSHQKACEFAQKYFHARGVKMNMDENNNLGAVGATAGVAHASPLGPASTEQSIEALEARLAEVSRRLARVELAHEDGVIQIGGRAPRGGDVSLLPSGLELFQQAVDWIFGLDGARTPPPDLRRFDNLYRILTGDLGWSGVFQPGQAFAGASSATLADLAVNAMNKVIVQLYDRLAHYRWYEPVVAVQATDGSLHDMAWIQFGGIANLPAVAEGAAYTELAVTDTKESDAFTKYGGYVGITEKMVRNSEIAKLQAIPRALTIAAIQTRSAAIASIFTANSGAGPTLEQDSTALFHANHANLATTAYSWTAWKAARLECAKQTELGSGKRQMLFPKYWLGPADLYDQALIDFGYGVGTGGFPGASGTPDVNPYGEARPGDPRPIPIAVPEFTDSNDWAYIVDPQLAPVICMAYANAPGGRAHPAPELFTVTSPLAGLMFTNDTMPIKIRDHFAYGVATYRGIGKRNVT